MKVSPMPPANREIRKRGAVLAAAICLAWIIGGGIGWLVLLPINSAVAAVPALVALGGLAALPGFTFLGWRYALRAIASRDAFLPMTALVVLISDLVVVGAMIVAAAVAAITGFVELDLANMAAAALWGIVQAAIGCIVLYVIGLLIFGLPGLLLAVPSSWYWEHRMRSAFSEPVPAGGGRGSGDQLH